MTYRNGLSAFVITLISLSIATAALGQGDAKAPANAEIKTDFEFVASVNGAPITQG